MSANNRPEPLSQDQIDKAVSCFAKGMKVSDVARELGISIYRAKGLLKRKEIADAVDRMRLTDTIPGKLDAIMETNLALMAWLKSADSRLCAVEEELRKVRTANRRLNVENKHLRETRRDANRLLREARAALWKARGY